jgi:RNA polymerase sigma-70 factor (ECF subfamily)
MSDTHQFEAFMQAYQNMVFTSAVRLLGNETEAEDVSQEVFLRAFAHFDALRHSTTAGGWLKTVTRNLCLNHLSRYRARWRFFSEMKSEESDADFAEELPGEDLRETTLDGGEQRQLLEQALHRLPAAQRVPLVLYHFEELGYDEIATQLGVSLSKIKTDIHRGRLALRRRLSRGQKNLYGQRT